MRLTHRIFQLFLPMLVLVLLAGRLTAQLYKPHWQLAGEEQKRYGIEKGKITYIFTGNARGTEIVVFDHWGWREKRETDKSTTTWGNTAEQKSTSLQDGNYVITHPHGSQIARAGQDWEINRSLEKASKAVEVYHAEEVLKHKGAVKIRTEYMLGRDCDVYENKNFSMKIWVWKGIIIKSEQVALDNKIVMECTKVDPEVDFTDQNFALPEGVEITGLPNAAGNE